MCSGLARLIRGGCRCGDAGVRAHERRGLDPIAGSYQGYAMVYGAPNTPTTQGFTNRYTPDGRSVDVLHVPPTEDARITLIDRFREASPTGKTSGGEMFARLPPQNFDGMQANGYLTLDARATPPNARKVTREQVDPWGSTAGKVSWMPGQMARQTVSG